MKEKIYLQKLYELWSMCILSYTDEASCGQIRIAKSSYSNKPLVGLQPWVVGGTVGKKGESPWQVFLNQVISM